MKFDAVGEPLARKEDARLLTGTGRFSDDISAPGQAYAAVVRATVAHAHIARIDSRAAMAMPGVLAIYTWEDCDALGVAPIEHDPVPSTAHDLKLTGPHGADIFPGPHHVLAKQRVRFVGEAVAFVVAETAAQALDAVEHVCVDYEELPATTDAVDALRTHAPKLWEEAPGNLLVDTTFGERAATDAAFDAAAVIVSEEFHIERVTGVPLEPRAALAVYDSVRGRLTLYTGSGGAVRQRREIAAALGIDIDTLRVVVRDVGGNFGTRNRVYPEFVLTLVAARALRRPIKYTASRSESFLSDYQGRDLTVRASLAFDETGRALAMRSDNLSNVGAYCVSLSPLAKGCALVTGPYDIKHAVVRARAVFTNTAPTQAYRSSGRPEVTYVIERLFERAAQRLGHDAIALRQRNLVGAKLMPYVNAVGAAYDSGDYEANLERAIGLAEWDTFEHRQRVWAKHGLLLGRGLAMYVESSTGSPHERAELRVHGADTVELVIGTQPSGQGHETSFAQVLADCLGIRVDDVCVVLGDTDRVSVGGGSHSGRSMRHAGAVIIQAADALIKVGHRCAAQVLSTSGENVHFEDGRFWARHSNRSLDWFELNQAVQTQGLASLEASANNEMHQPVFPNGCAICEVLVDPDTGQMRIQKYVSVDDVGRCINPLIVHGQTHGGVVQGIGQALGELCQVDTASGQPLCGSLLDYQLPRAADIPSITTEIVEVLSPTNPLGIKAGGEGGTTPALAVVVNAAFDALQPLGVESLAMPLTPGRLWAAIRAARDGKTPVSSGTKVTRVSG
ncbi:MAG: xanthine dehydrogenase family protein molybdopterin-binding subunit [Gammaproteobacteria bacterium]|nr:xanthine dehydrogenase family protein molybdopterin-binding subunit [Gammaproteobacteria bacterium]